MLIYKGILQLSALNNMYRYSIEFYFELFKEALENKSHDDDDDVDIKLRISLIYQKLIKVILSYYYMEFN